MKTFEKYIWKNSGNVPHISFLYSEVLKFKTQSYNHVLQSYVLNDSFNIGPVKRFSSKL